MAQTPLTTAHVTGRVAAAILGGYAFTWSFTAFGIAGLVALGWDYHEAETGVLMLAFLVFLGLFLWAFAAASLTRVWLVLAAGAVLMSAAASALQRSLIA
ncbi:iron uptake protein [Caldimonas tepidiphila]|uniref:iron uptake protein n=1 Tax=Caldimonas tepidiphila TaxID=2315841 RepID=UPI000E5A3A7B|nr:iron uptake protein [Caldimonas tepidiphila]